MTEPPPPSIGTVAQEVARLLEDMATMGHPSASSEGLRPYPDGPAKEPPPPDPRGTARPPEDDGSDEYQPEGFEDTDEPWTGACSVCGAEREDARQTPASCKLCPLCRGIAFFRAVRPETVDLLADLALAMASSLRDVAARSRASDPASSASAPGGTSRGARVTVQDIPVGDESQD